MANPNLTPEQVQALQDIGQLTGKTAEQIVAPQTSSSEEAPVDPIAAAPIASAELPVSSSLNAPAQETMTETVTPQAASLTEKINVGEPEQPAPAPTPEQPAATTPSKPGMTFEEAKKALLEDEMAVRGRTDVTDDEVLDYLSDQKKAEEDLKMEEKVANDEKTLELQRQVAYRKNQLAKARSLGVELPPNPELDELVKAADDMESVGVDVTGATQTATPEDIEKAKIPTKEEVEIEAQPLRQEAAKAEAKQQVVNQQVAKEQDRIATAEANLEKAREQMDELREVNPERFWNNKSTWEKIGLIFASGSKNVFNSINKQIENDINLQQTDRKTALQKYDSAMKAVQQEVDRRSSKINDAFKLQQLSNLKQDAFMKQQQAQAQLKQMELLNSGNLQTTDGLPKEKADKAVRLPNGKLAFADNKAAADDLRKFNADIEPAIAGANRVLKLAKQGSRFSLKDRGIIAADMKALVGQLRIPFTGPGILTDKEYDRLMDTLGDPTAFFALPSVERQKLRTVINKLSSDRRIRYKQVGIDLPKSKRERLIEHNLKTGKGDVDQIETSIDQMIERGDLSEDFKN